MKSHFYGDEAARIGEVTQNVLMDFLRSALLASSQFGVSSTITPGGVLVTNSLATARARFLTSDNQAFVLLMPGPHEQSFERIRVLAGNAEGNNGTEATPGLYRGARHEWTWGIQLSARNDTDARTGPSNAPSLDRQLADFLSQTVREGYRALKLLGLSETSLKADAENQNSATKINPHLLRCVTYTRESNLI